MSALGAQTLEHTATFAPNILAWETSLEDAPVTWINTALSPLSSSLLSFLTPTETVVKPLGFASKEQILFDIGLVISIRDCFRRRLTLD